MTPLTATETVVAQAVARASDPVRFGRWWDQVTSTGYCRRPVRLSGHTREVDRATGKVRTTFDTADEPDGVLLVACGNRRESVCPSCAATYRGDAYQLIAAGLRGGKGVPETVARHPALFVTFTAPSFGPVHTARTSNGRPVPCRPRRKSARCDHGVPVSCFQRHDGDDAQVGAPLCRDCFDYDATVVFNAFAPELWRRTTVYIRRALAHRLGLSALEARRRVKVSYTKVAEYQARGAIHFHAVIRLDAGTDRDGIAQPPTTATAEALEDAIRTAAAKVAVPVDVPDRPTMWVEWGDQLDVRTITLNTPTAGITSGDVAAYVAKYATKSTEAFGLPPWRIHEPGDIDRLDVNDHTGALVRAAWTLGVHEPLTGMRRWAHALGFGGHWSTKSRRYSTTFGRLRQARRNYARRRRTGGPATDAWGRPEDEQATAPEGHWRFVGTGHRTHGDAWLAEAAAARARERRRIARQEVYGTTTTRPLREGAEQ